jgi:hypothetical protein
MITHITFKPHNYNITWETLGYYVQAIILAKCEGCICLLSTRALKSVTVLGSCVPMPCSALSLLQYLVFVAVYLENFNSLPRNVDVKIYKTIILPVILYGCETWSLTLREENRLIVF